MSLDNMQNLWRAMPGFLSSHWREPVEIFILTITIYYAVSFLRRTRGAPVIAGFFILIVLTLVATVLDFKVLSWLLRGFFAFSAVAVLVIFQPELRRLLAELGNRPLLNPGSDQRENIEVIIQTAERLADVRIGALIAIEQTIQLQDAVESGIAIDCQATSEMLETIFFPNNAIHDGGVIIRGDRIAYAACIFPLTQRQDLNKSLGTRHRAAIGLTEDTDAVVVVVSEETGAVSYAYRGELVRNVTIEALRAFLTSVMVPRYSRSRSAFGWLRNLAQNRVLPSAAVVAKGDPEVETKTEHR